MDAVSFADGLNRIETPRNVVFEKQPDRGVRIVKYVGDRDAGTLNVLYEYTYSDEEWREIVKAMAKSYVEPPPEPEPEPEPEPDAASDADALATVAGVTDDGLSDAG